MLINVSMKIVLVFLCLIGFNAAAASADEHADTLSKGKVYLVCNGHLDTQWNWDVRTTIQEYIPRVMLQNLYLMDRYPEYRFNFEGGVKYAWMKEYYSACYDKVKEKIVSGQWHVSGASWDANDTNIPSPESAFRNILLAQEFYKQEFGSGSDDVFLPDCFGFSYTLPTIAAHCGLIGMSTQKLNWRTNAFYDDAYHKKNPFSWGKWTGIDGKSVIAAFDTGGYNAELPENFQKNKILRKRAENGFENVCYRYYSGGDKSGSLRTGDRGNSGTVATCRRLENAMEDSTSVLDFVSAASNELYHDYLDRKEELPEYEGELLMDVHGTGCYTAQSAMKYYNRRNEELVGASERASVAADWSGALAYNKDIHNEIWKRFLWHQFHDDLTGTSIPEAYSFSWNDELISLRQSTDQMTTAVAAFSYNLDTRTKGIPLVVYNAVTSDIKGVVEASLPLEDDVESFYAYAPDGTSVPVQILDRKGKETDIIFAAEVPSSGFAVYDIRPVQRKAESPLSVGSHFIENRVYKVKLDRNGDIVSIIDKRYVKELVAEGKAFRLTVTRGNASVKWPAWEIQKEVIDRQADPIDENVGISIVEYGPVRATVKVERTHGDSRFVQYISLTDGAFDDRIDIETSIDWRESDALLKAEFPMAVSNSVAKYDLGLGYVNRGNNTAIAYEVPAQKWADITDSDNSYGITILNDCKYGWDKPADNVLRLTLIHTPGVESRYVHQGDLDKGINKFKYSIMGHCGNVGMSAYMSAEELNMPLMAFSVPEHDGPSGKLFSMVSSSVPELGIRALKKAENGDGYIVRCYNLTDKPVQGELIFPGLLVSAEECNGVEERISDIPVSGNSVFVTVGKFEPKTYRIRLAESSMPKMQRKSDGPIELPFNAIAFTTDEFYTYYAFDSQRGTYAAEILPDSLFCRGVLFRLGNENEPDVTLCKGQTISLPQGYDKLYLLVAAADSASKAVFSFGEDAREVDIPLWKGFYGQWGWYGYSEPFLKDDVLAYIGTHRHQGDTGNLPYDFSYIYRIGFDIPENADSITFPDDANVAVFAMTASEGSIDRVILLTETFTGPAEGL